jgi:hypothetical protein
MDKKLTDEQKGFLKLVERSMKGREWATVSDVLMFMTKRVVGEMPDYLELDVEQQLIRPTEKGYALLDAMKVL